MENFTSRSDMLFTRFDKSLFKVFAALTLFALKYRHIYSNYIKRETILVWADARTYLALSKALTPKVDDFVVSSYSYVDINCSLTV